MVIADEVLDSSNSAVIQQARNRTFAAQAVLKEILEETVKTKDFDRNA
jgi:N-succinyl-L-ornithine transcarbamylase